MSNIDVDVERGNIVSPRELPFSRNVRTLENQVFHTSKELHLYYLTVDQLNIFNNYPKAIIQGTGGCGKNLTMLFKIIDVLNNQPDAKVVVIVPRPHTIHCVNLLKENNVSCQLLARFPHRHMRWESEEIEIEYN